MSEDPAILAFEALRKEVASLSARLDRMPSKIQASAPDYALTLGQIAKAVDNLTETSSMLAPEPWLKAVAGNIHQLTTRTLQAQISPYAREHQQHIEDLRTLVGDAKALEASRWIVGGLLSCGALVGICLWIALSGPIARVLPRGLQVPERMAAATLDLDQWEAGSQLLATSDPATWNRMKASERLVRANRSRLSECLSIAKDGHGAVHCAVAIASPSETMVGLGLVKSRPAIRKRARPRQ